MKQIVIIYDVANIFFFYNNVFHQTVDSLIGTNCASLFAFFLIIMLEIAVSR